MRQTYIGQTQKWRQHLHPWETKSELQPPELRSWLWGIKTTAGRRKVSGTALWSQAGASCLFSLWCYTTEHFLASVHWKCRNTSLLTTVLFLLCLGSKPVCCSFTYMNVFMFPSGILSCRTLHSNICLVRGLDVTGSLSLMNKPDPGETSSWMLRSSLNRLKWRGSGVTTLTSINGAKEETKYTVTFQAYKGKYPLQILKH